MRRVLLAIFFGLSLSCWMIAQEPAKSGTAESKQESEGDSLNGWKWANFVILVAGLGYLVAKNVPPMFRKRTEEIQQSIAASAQLKKAAEERAAALDKRLAGIKAEIEQLRSDAHVQTGTEGERIRRETSERLEKIKNQTAAEIGLMIRASRDELRRYAASLALDLAEQRVRTRVGKDTQDSLVDGFLHDLRVAPGGRT